MKTLIKYEFRKIFGRRISMIALSAVILLSFLLTVSTWQNLYAFDGKNREGTGQTAVEIDKSIAETYRGVLTDRKVRQMMSDFAPKTDLHGLHARYLYQNAIQSAFFYRFSDLNGNWNGLSVSDVYDEEEITVGYIDGWLKTSQNMVKIFLVLSLAVLLAAAPVYAGEYGGMDNILLTGKYGRTKCALAKGIAVFLYAFLATMLLTVLNLLPAAAIYGTEGLESSVLFCSADFGDCYIPFNITCSTLLKYQVLLAFTGILGAAGTALLLSAVAKNGLAAFAGAAAVYFLPLLLPVTETSPLFRYLALLPLYHVQFTALMSIEQLKGSILYAVFAVPVALAIAAAGFTASRVIFARHQVH